VLGMFFSSMCSRTSTATAWTYSVVVVVSLLSLIVLLGADILSFAVRRTVFIPNPVTAVLDAAGMPNFQSYHLFTAHLRLIAAATVGLFAVTVVRVWHLCRSN